jgi:hypothetical protein
MVARQQIQRLLAGAQQKIAALDRLLREHLCESVLIFSESNAVVYQISATYFIPALTHETKAAERKEILEGFQSGRYRAVVTSKVLNEGVDVPDAKVAIVLGGNAGAREYIQRASCAKWATVRLCSTRSSCATRSMYGAPNVAAHAPSNGAKGPRTTDDRPPMTNDE